MVSVAEASSTKLVHEELRAAPYAPLWLAVHSGYHGPAAAAGLTDAERARAPTQGKLATALQLPR